MKKKINIISLEIRLSLMVVLLFSVVINNIYFSFIIDTLAIIIYSIFLYKKTRFLFFYSFIILSLLRLIISSYILDYFNVFLTYSEEVTFYKGSLDEFLIISSVIIELSYYLYKKINFSQDNGKLLKYLKGRMYYFIQITILCSVFHVFFIRRQMGFIHRVEFASKFLENNIFNHFLQIIIMGGMIVSGLIFKSSKIKGFLLLCSLFLYGYLIGEKFGYFFYILCFLLLGIAINTSNKQCKSYLKYVGCFLMGLIFCCITVISTMYKISPSEAVVFFEQRVCQDNESWWYFYDKDYDDLNIINEIKAFQYKGIGNLYDIGYENARLFGSHMLAEKMKGYKIVKGEYDRKKRIAAGSMTQIKLYGRQYYLLIIMYSYIIYFVLKTLVNLFKLKFNNILINLFLYTYISFLLRFYIQIESGLFQINNEFISIKAIYFLVIIYFYKTIIYVLKRFKNKKIKSQINCNMKNLNY